MITNGNSFFVFLFAELILQVALYWLCGKAKIKWLDFLVFAFFLLANIWLFPKILLPSDDSMGSCAFSPGGMGYFFFFVFGISVTIVAFIGNGIFRTFLEDRKSSTAKKH